MSQFDSDPNPFASPTADTASAPPARGSSMPTYCRVMFIISLVFAVLRLISLPFTVIGMFALQQQGNAMASQAMGELVTACGIALFGIVGNGMMLAGKKFGLYLGWGVVLSVLASLGVGIVQASFMFDQYPEGSPERMGAMIGLIFALLFRLAFLGAYIYALLQFSKWVERQPAGR